MFLRWLTAWFVILVLAVLNGFVREAALVPLMGKAPGYVASGLLLQGRSWGEMLAQYTFADGNIWPLVLVAVFFAPWIGWRYNGAS